MTLEAKAPIPELALAPDAPPKARKRGMPDLHAQDKGVARIIDRWLKAHQASGNEVSRFEWDREDLEFENFLLTRNPLENRDLRETQIDEMVDWRLAGNDFRNLNDAICINTDGLLETGQHRCVAGMRAGIGSRHIVQIGPPAFANQSDLGSPIKTKDRWKREDVSRKHQKQRYATIRLLLAIERDTLSPTVRTDKRVYDRSLALNGSELFEDAILYGSQPGLPFPSNATFSVAYYLIGGSVTGKIFLDEIVAGTKRTKHMRNINGLRAYLQRIDKNSKSGDKLFRPGDALNLLALSAIIRARNSYPVVPKTYTWDGEALVPRIMTK